MTEIYDGGATVTEEYKLYQGLDRIFEQVQSLPTTRDMKNGLGLMVLEMDLALKAFEDGNVANAIDHHKNMLRYSRAVLGDTDTLTGRSEAAKAAEAKNVMTDVRMLCASLMTTGSIVTGDVTAEAAAKQPWSETLGAIAEAYRKQQADSIAQLRLMSDAETKASIEAAPVAEAKTRAMREPVPFIFAHASVPSFTVAGMEERQPPGVLETRWARREYKTLALVLEGITKPQKGAPKYSAARREATVALACLKAINRRELAMGERQRSGGDVRHAEEHGEVREYAARLQDYMTRLKKNDDVSKGAKMNLKRFGLPAMTAARGLEKTLKAPGILSRAFRSALSFGAAVLGKKAPQAAVSRPEKYVP